MNVLDQIVGDARALRALGYTLLGGLLLGGAAPAKAQFPDFDDPGGGIDLSEFFEEAEDYDLLAHSCYTEPWRWPGVASGGEEDAAWRGVSLPDHRRFAAVKGEADFPAREAARPVTGAPVGISLAVPEAGRYRIWMSYVTAPGRTLPVELRLSGAEGERSHTYGRIPLPRGDPETLDPDLPVRFDSEMDALRLRASGDEAVVWEFWDTELEAGPHRLSLRSENPDVRVDALFLTRSRAFEPSKAMFLPGRDRNESTLHRVYYRFRVSETDTPKTPVKVTTFVRYKTAHYRRGNDRRLWYSSFMPGSTRPIPDAKGRGLLRPGDWSEWLDETELATSPGRYGNCRLTVEGLEEGELEIQLAWYPHEAAVVRTVRVPVSRGRSMFMFPVSRYGYPPPEGSATNGVESVWGVMDAGYVSEFQSEGDALDRLIRLMQTDEIDAFRPLERIHLYTGCGVSPAYYDRIVPPLKNVGINWLRGLPLEVREKYGLAKGRILAQQGSVVHARNHSPLDPTFEPWAEDWAEGALEGLLRDDPEVLEREIYLKMGDEIGPISGPEHINGLPDVRAAFHEYLREILAAENRDLSFFGVPELSDIDYSLERSAGMGRFRRRVYYHSARFEWVLTSRYYERFTRAVERVMPGIRTGCNHTPGSFMFGGDMRSSNWFSLARRGGSSTAQGEGWVRTGGRYGFAGTQTISYYAEILDCAARPRALPKWFLLVGSCGDIDRKMISLVARGIFLIHLYDWGPSYLGGDSFSDAPWAYPQINRGARALSPAEDIIVEGHPSPSRVALVYNRAHEIWHSGSMGLYIDRLFTFLALQHAQIPVDVVLETDLTPATLAAYDVVYLNGFNLPRANLLALADWVRAGGTLYGAAGSAMRDEYDDALPETAALFGAGQRLNGVSKSNWSYSPWWPIGLRTHAPIDTLTVRESELTPAMRAGVVGPRFELTPTTGRPVAFYEDGTCAGVIHEVGKGRTLLLGVSPGMLYGHNAPFDWEPPLEHPHPVNYTADRRALISRAALRVVGEPDTTYSNPLVEITRFEHPEKGIAVLLADYAWDPGAEAVLSVRTDRDLPEVRSAMRGALKWRREGDRMVIPLPAPDPVDVVTLRARSKGSRKNLQDSVSK